MPAARLALALLLACLALAPARAQQGAPAVPALRLLPVARGIGLDLPLAEAQRLLRAAGLVIEEETPLPPDSLLRLVVAVPRDDDCVPRAEQWSCPNLRVLLHRDGSRGYRVMRVESYERLDPAVAPSVEQVFGWAASGNGPPQETASWGERIRGGRLNMWRQLWRDPARDGQETEIVATLWGDPGQPQDLGSPQDSAVGIGYAHADTAVENFVAAMRRRLPDLR